MTVEASRADMYGSRARIGYTSPPLTTVRVDLAEVGRLAANTLARKMKSPVTEPERRVVPVELKVRGTTAPAGPPLTSQPSRWNQTTAALAGDR